MSRDDNVKVEGTVVKVHSGGMYQVETDDGRSSPNQAVGENVPIQNQGAVRRSSYRSALAL